MTQYVVRLRYSPEAFRGMVQDPRSRAEDLQKLVNGCGMTLILGGFCVATGEVFSIVEATPKQAGAAEFAAMATGAFIEINAYQLISFEEMVGMMKDAGQVLGQYRPPNQDEIARVLLDE